MEEDEEEYTTPPFEEGLYTGIFSVYYSLSDTAVSDSTWVQFKEGHFTNPQNPSHYPLGGTGTYIDLIDSIEFTQYVACPGIYNWNLYLAGKYAYSQAENHLIFQKNVAEAIYQYDLFRE